MEELVLPTSEAMLDGMTHLVSDQALEGKTLLLNMGPQHPSTHGVLRLLLELDGEKVISVIPDIGFLHTGVEKNMEAKTYIKAAVMTDRLDYLNTVGNVLAYVMAIEKLAESGCAAARSGDSSHPDRAAAYRLPPGLAGHVCIGFGRDVRFPVLLS